MLPAARKDHFGMSKISEQKFNANISRFYVRTPNRAKQTFFMDYVKRTEKMSR